MKLWQIITAATGAAIVGGIATTVGCKIAEKINNTRIRIKNSKNQKEGN